MTSVEVDRTVQDKIESVLFRLDQGERLTQGVLRCNDNFCVLGLFADESDMGGWDGNYYVVGFETNMQTLGLALTEYYNMNSSGGAFMVRDLPEDLKHILIDEGIINDDYYEKFSLNITAINDNELLTNETRNSIMAAIIRSGALFRNKGDN